MSTIATVTLHIKENLSQVKDLDALQDELRAIAGVEKVALGSGTASHHLIIVNFDWNKLHPRQLVDHLANRGLKAEALG